jgi:hypothetical protein
MLYQSCPVTKIKAAGVLSHPCDKSKDVARMGHPNAVAELAKSKS